MKKKHYLILQTCLNGAATLFFLSTPFWFPGSGNTLFLLPAAAFAYLTVRNFKLIKETKDGERVYAPDAEDSIPEQIAYYKAYMYVAAIGCILLTMINIVDLNDLISGNEKHVRLSAPVSFVYKHFGYWPAVCTIPIVGMILIGLGILKIRSLKSSDQKK